MTCIQCSKEFDSTRKDAKFCGPACRKEAFQKRSVGTDNVTLSEPKGTDKFKFTIRVGKNNPDDVREAKNRVREATHWTDVPLAAVPVLQKGWPEVPTFETLHGLEPMNGRQYFLWWKNDFKKQEDGTPIIHNPFPASKLPVVYIQAGENSRHWGTN